MYNSQFYDEVFLNFRSPEKITLKSYNLLIKTRVEFNRIIRSHFEVNKFLNIFRFFHSVNRTMDCKEPPAPCSVLFSDAPPPSPPDCPPQRLTREQLLPPTPSVQCDKKYAFSPQLQEFCLKHPIAVVRGIAAVLKLG